MAKDFRDSPYDGEPAISDLEEAVLGLLEEAGIDTATNDAIVKLINAAERRRDEGEPPPCICPDGHHHGSYIAQANCPEHGWKE